MHQIQKFRCVLSSNECLRQRLRQSNQSATAIHPRSYAPYSLQGIAQIPTLFNGSCVSKVEGECCALAERFERKVDVEFEWRN
ncbi:hypothetical protein BCR33DRAFT_720679 [Rhizoclosmatium globosum]|uniref:Uncharacterized protein n=1 Tax=Rhizoclosmatium globosum TaxID=329046 RepID=A0A1Y2BVC5_9FUNG|nr:hypothetical protein BCR33DRAFT_720679 [Rhizoclosmatium globosum]|eukprot:ORY38683.1 hypothetical protein BCR33DRAFT_720679 [Rhizoclosmatium globosum]